MCEKAVRLQQESKELQERLMVSEATVQAQAEQLKDYRELLSEWTKSAFLILKVVLVGILNINIRCKIRCDTLVQLCKQLMR